MGFFKFINEFCMIDLSKQITTCWKRHTKKKHLLNFYSYQNNYQTLKISKLMCLLISELQLGVNIYNGLC